ncbi:MAG TPA: molybdopterin-dependent oxidoreductase [Nitrososphaerales archaeon]|nr:molybdopterin-dependent oxidoreductase [Nitrososphaerales archaeon]
MKRVLKSLPEFRAKKHSSFKGLSIFVDEKEILKIKNVERYPTAKLTEDFRCLEGWEVKGVAWEGVRVSSLLSEVNLSPKIRWVLFGSGEFTWQIKLGDALKDTTLLATKMNGSSISTVHGGPLRLVFRGQRCFESVKSVDRIVLLKKGVNPTAELIAKSRIREKKQ